MWSHCLNKPSFYQLLRRSKGNNMPFGIRRTLPDSCFLNCPIPFGAGYPTENPIPVIGLYTDCLLNCRTQLLPLALAHRLSLSYYYVFILQTYTNFNKMSKDLPITFVKSVIFKQNTHLMILNRQTSIM